MYKKRIAVINIDFEDASAGALARRLFFYGRDKGFTMFAFYGRGKKSNEENICKFEHNIEVYVHKLLSLVTGLQGYFSFFATRRLIRKLEKNKINVAILVQIHGYYLNENMLLMYLKKNHVKTIYVTSDEYAGLGKCCYSLDCEKYKVKCEHCALIHDYPKSLFFDTSKFIWERKRKSYNGLNISFIGPQTNINKFKESALLKDKPLYIADWGIDTNLYKYYQHNDIYEKYNIPKNKIYILTVAPYSLERKGVKKYFFEAAKKEKNEKIHFINVGYDGNPKINQIPSNMTTIPFIKDQKELAKIYSLADLYVLASIQDTMPLSCLIAFACETPVCCFYVSGLRYLVVDEDGIINYINEISVDGLVEVIDKIQKKSDYIREKCRKYALNRYSEDIFNRKVYEIIE